MIDIDKIEALAKAVPDGTWEEIYELSERWRDILALVAEVRAWRTRFPGHVHRPQDECIALRMWLDRDEAKYECPKCGAKDLPAGAYCKGIACPLNPSQAKEKS